MHQNKRETFEPYFTLTFFLQILLQMLSEILITLEDSKLTLENKLTCYIEGDEKKDELVSRNKKIVRSNSENLTCK